MDPRQRTNDRRARTAAILLFLLTFLLAPPLITFLLWALPDATPWWIVPGATLALALYLWSQRRPAGFGLALGTVTWIGLLVVLVNS